MRKLMVCNTMSLDGYVERPGGDVMSLPFDHGFSEYNAERLRAADTLLLGRRSYEGFLSHWPAIADDPDAPPLEREISRRIDDVDKVVVSDTRIAELRNGPGRDVIVLGSHILWNDLPAHGLVDELHFMIGPGVVGAGTRAFESGPPLPLRLLGTPTWDGSGLVLVRYAVEGDRAR
ncbi:dihydrofolate reductase family protein [Streptomyces sp. NPDC015127]|uniref:dihydrofolate reductase family protein n=1 Tax=Streptomyces sp. NPDC015127 TaxID=3364939 RepID=UPI0036F59833